MAGEEILEARKGTYSGFLRLMTVSLVGIIIILALMALFLT